MYLAYISGMVSGLLAGFVSLVHAGTGMPTYTRDLSLGTYRTAYNAGMAGAVVWIASDCCCRLALMFALVEHLLKTVVGNGGSKCDVPDPIRSGNSIVAATRLDIQFLCLSVLCFHARLDGSLKRNKLVCSPNTLLLL